MEKLVFLTGNKNKLREAREILPEFDIVSEDVDLPELQEINEELIVTDKIRRAMKLFDTPVFIEDTSLVFSALNGLPGPLVKWFEKTVGLQGMVEMISTNSDKSAVAKSYIGYGDPLTGKIDLFEGVVNGRIVEPTGKSDFGWDPIFIENLVRDLHGV